MHLLASGYRLKFPGSRLRLKLRLCARLPILVSWSFGLGAIRSSCTLYHTNRKYLDLSWTKSNRLLCCNPTIQLTDSTFQLSNHLTISPSSQVGIRAGTGAEIEELELELELELGIWSFEDDHNSACRIKSSWNVTLVPGLVTSVVSLARTNM